MRGPDFLIPLPLAANEPPSADAATLRRDIAQTRTMTYSNNFSYWNQRDRLVCLLNALGVAMAGEGLLDLADETFEQARAELLAPPAYPLGDMPVSYGVRVDNLLTILNANLALRQMYGGGASLAAHWLGLAHMSFSDASKMADQNPLFRTISDKLDELDATAAMLRER